MSCNTGYIVATDGAPKCVTRGEFEQHIGYKLDTPKSDFNGSVSLIEVGMLAIIITLVILIFKKK